MLVQHPPSAEPDLLLLQQFIDTGDPERFAEIVQRYARVVYAASLRVLGDEGRAQDVSQETFFRLMQRPKLVTHSLAGWLHRTATHLALDVRRGEKSRRRREQVYGLEQQQMAKSQRESCRDSWAEVSPFVDQALNEIEEPARGLLIRHFLQGVQQADLAAELDVSPATLSRRIKAGLEQLASILHKRGIYVGVAVLAGFCANQTQAAVPSVLVTEMGKMNLIASLRNLPATPPPPSGPYHAPYQMACKPHLFLSGKYTAALVGVSVILAGYLLSAQWSWMQANLSPTLVAEHHEPVRTGR